MHELDQVWSEMLSDATRKAEAAGSRDVVEYLRLKSSNDAIRERGTRWLCDTIVKIAAAALHDNANLKIERESPHTFSRGPANMVGSLVRLRQGVRCMTVEAGWARTPSDGIMRGRALAVGRITHFGLPKHNTELRLLRGDELPYWIDESDNVVVSSEWLRSHFELFMEISS
ncbi:MAG TPA: hypothetical protein VNA17_04170 [Pyrinomonadaceae bacterium]|nr:hypothetical protein [Pyrinomonadaceae bacterium]